MADELPPPYSIHDPRNGGPPAAPRPAVPNPHGFADIGTGAAHIAGASYFETRPLVLPTPSRALPLHIAVLPETTSQDLPLPQPSWILMERDVHAHDWMTFVNHMIPYDAPATGHSLASQRYEKAGSSGSKTLKPAPSAAGMTEPERIARINAITSVWNRGFFLPRGLEIFVSVEATSSSSSSSNHHISSTVCRRPSQPSSPNPTSPSARSCHPSSSKSGKDKADSRLGNALYQAVSKQDVPTVQLLIESGADPNSRPYYETPTLVKAIDKGNLEIVRKLLAHGAEVDANATGHETALYTAVSKGKADLVQLLLHHDADPNKRPSGQNPALCVAVSKGYSDITNLLLNDPKTKIDEAAPSRHTAMYQASEKGNIELTKRLLEAGAKPDAHPLGIETAMRAAARRGDNDMVKLLLEHGARVDAAPTGQNTALYNVVTKKDPAMVKMLLEHGADIHAKTWGGETVLERVVSKGKTEMVQLLLKYKDGKPGK